MVLQENERRLLGTTEENGYWQPCQVLPPKIDLTVKLIIIKGRLRWVFMSLWEHRKAKS